MRASVGHCSATRIDTVNRESQRAFSATCRARGEQRRDLQCVTRAGGWRNSEVCQCHVATFVARRHDHARSRRCIGERFRVLGLAIGDEPERTTERSGAIDRGSHA
jgi:hypothetical protein